MTSLAGFMLCASTLLEDGKDGGHTLKNLTEKGIEHRGVWLSNGGARAFVAVRPRTRVLRYLPDSGSEPMLRLGGTHYDTGIRTWFMEDDRQTEFAYRPAMSTGEILELSAAAVSVKSEWRDEPGFETAVIMEVALLDDGRLHIRHGAHNLSGRPRNLAAWSITAFPVGGVIEMPFDRPEVRPVTLFGDTSPDDLAAAMREEGLLIDTSRQFVGKALKYGLLAKKGEISHIAPSGEIWTSSAPYSHDGQYPDGGANITAYVSAKLPDDGSWAEIEQVGAARRVEPNSAIWLEETICLSGSDLIRNA